MIAAVSLSVSAEVLQEITVKEGDTVWSIANTYLKDPKKWPEILKHNNLPVTDPTSALPGMKLKIPVLLIKEELRKATLVYLLNEVHARKKNEAGWKRAAKDMDLYNGDGLRTMEHARVHVNFYSGDLLKLDQNTLVILKPELKTEEVNLLAGTVRADRVNLVTPTARVTPKTVDTVYKARLRNDQALIVQVEKGKTEVLELETGKSVIVSEGYANITIPHRPPSVPVRVPKMPDFQVAEFTAAGELVPGKVVATQGTFIKKDTSSFSEGDLDVELLKNTLKNKSAINNLVLEKLNRSKGPEERFDSVTERQALEAFNAILRMPDFFLLADDKNLTFRVETSQLLDKAKNSAVSGKSLSQQELLILNKALLREIYSRETAKSLKIGPLPGYRPGQDEKRPREYDSDAARKQSDFKFKKGYRIQIASDPKFSQIVVDQEGDMESQDPVLDAAAYPLPDGTYYRRVSYYDESKRWGEFVTLPTQELDREPPRLTLFSPPEEFVTRKGDVSVEGQTNAGCFVFVNGYQVPTRSDGKFLRAVVLPKEGTYKITVVTKNRKGNATEMKRTVYKRKGLSLDSEE